MPHAFRVYAHLRGAGISDASCNAIALLISEAKSDSARYVEDDAMDSICDAGLSEPLAEAIARVVANCYFSERFSRSFDRSPLKVALVRSGWPAPIADALLDAIAPCVVTPIGREIRTPIRYVPPPGKVVMCDFSFLRKPEMQKERRAIVLSTPSASGVGRCIVVPVSMTPSAHPNPHHYRFEPGAYPFFHSSAPVWATCDHIYTVSLERMWRVNVQRRPCLPSVSQSDLDGVRAMAGTSLGLSR